jgi:hypothetical protein
MDIRCCTEIVVPFKKISNKIGFKNQNKKLITSKLPFAHINTGLLQSVFNTVTQSLFKSKLHCCPLVKLNDEVLNPVGH